MAKAPAFQFYVTDFLVGTSRMSAEQIGGYILLLCEQWDKGYIPNDDAEILEISRLKEKNLAAVKRKFFLCDDGHLRNPRLEQERDKQLHYREKQAVNGAKGGRPNKGKVNAEKPNPIPSLSDDEAKKSSSSSSSSLSSVFKEEDARAREVLTEADPLPDTTVKPRPDNAPPDEDVLEYFMQQGKIEMAESFIETHNGNGWTDSDGEPIGKWRLWAGGWIARRQAATEKEARKAQKEAAKKPKKSTYVMKREDFYSEDEWQDFLNKSKKAEA